MFDKFKLLEDVLETLTAKKFCLQLALLFDIVGAVQQILYVYVFFLTFLHK